MGLTLQVYNQSDIDRLPAHIQAYLSTLDIYYQPGFLACDARMQGGTYELAVCTNETEIWVYPYIVLPIPETGYFDISSPYGYAGPVATSEDILSEAEALFVAHIAERKEIITEFVRYHYLYNDTHFFTQNCTNILNRKVVVLPTNDPEWIWTNEFSGTNRNLVRKLEKEGYEWQITPFALEDVSAFREAYRANMVHSGATDFYFFEESFFQDLIEQLGEQLLFAKVEKGGVIFASALFFVSGKIVTYYLSARNLEHPKVPASNLLLSKMAFWAAENGMKYLNFGGGLSLDENDFLFKFKSNFSKHTRDFYIGKRIHQSHIYTELQQQYISRYGEEAFGKVRAILQFYR